MGFYRHRLSFSAEHDTADLSELPVLLGLRCNSLWKAGEPKVSPNGRVIGGNRGTSFCSMDIEAKDDLAASLVAAIKHLQHHKDVLTRFSDEGVAFYFFMGWFSMDWNSGERLEWTLLRDIAALKITLDFDFYGPGETPEETS